ncbi:MAG TPA: sialate O-acetylesterase [Flavisolibacter sp.]
MIKKLLLPLIRFVLTTGLNVYPIFSIAQSPVKVFILAGQSNMVGHGEVYASAARRAAGSLEYEIAHDSAGFYGNLRDKEGKWKKRPDVWVYFDRGEEIKKGDLSVGYGATDGEIGPEFQFGNVVGDRVSSQVLLIKTAWGGKSLGIDFRPPGSGGTTGFFYKKMIADIQGVLNNLQTIFPQYRGQGYELSGFVWNQGWNDAGDSNLYNEYKANMIHLIQDVRKDLQAPGLPFVLINCGQGGFQSTPDRWMRRVQTFIVSAQSDAANSSDAGGNIALVDTRPFWRDSLQSPAKEVHHYNRNAATYCLMGDAAGHAMMQLLKNQKATTNRDASDGEINNDGLMGYISFRTSPQPRGYAAGIGFYSAVYSMLPKPIHSFQIGLASTWIIPDNSENLTQPLCPPGTYARENWGERRGPTFKDVFQTIEGGLGIWGSTQFRAGYTSPKFQIVAVPDCYTGNYLISPGWGNSPRVTEDNKMGIAQISNRLLVPPDGITFRENPKGKLFGYSWMSLPFSGVKKQDPPTGNQYWTLFFAVSNFNGPVAFIIPESWSKISANYPFDHNRGLDSRGGLSGGGAQEINTVPYFEMKDNSGTTYSRIPEFLYPVNANGETVLIQDVRYYSSKALADAFAKWRKGGPECSGRFRISDSSSVLAKLKALPFNFHQTDGKIPLVGFDETVQTAVFNDSTAFGLRWFPSPISDIGVLPQYFKQSGNLRTCVSSTAVPKELTEKEFAPAVNGTDYTSPASGSWAEPGPARGPYYAYLADGSRVTYYWYRFIDQPSLQQYKHVWSDSLRSALQGLVEKIHHHWTIDKEYMPPPARGQKLAPLDPALIVKPPAGLEVGYVPIVTAQGQYAKKASSKMSFRRITKGDKKG